jgi:hypothetical protein
MSPEGGRVALGMYLSSWCSSLFFIVTYFFVLPHNLTYLLFKKYVANCKNSFLKTKGK